MLETQLQWFTVYTKARSERQVATRIEEWESTKLPKMESYVPTIRKPHKWSDRVKMVDVPVFPSYVFVHASVKHESPLRNIPGVVVPITFGGKMAVIPDNEIGFMRTALQEKLDFVVENAEKLHKGVKVRVLEGTFRNAVGILIDNGDVKGENCNFGVKIEALNSLFLIYIDKELLEVISDEDTGDQQRKKYNF
jgi:transcription antitermination factor NusG